MHHYSLETGSSRIEVSKGTYLTMLRRKPSTVKTLRKHKPISPTVFRKKTTKKQYTGVGRKLRKGKRVSEVFIQGMNGT